MAQRYHHGDLKESLMVEALKQLDTGEELSLRGLARGIGVSHGAPYKHFEDRSALLTALANRIFYDIKNELERIRMRADLSLEEKLAAFLAWVEREIAAKPARVQLLLSREVSIESELLRQFHRLFQSEKLAELFYCALRGQLGRGSLDLLREFAKFPSNI